MKDKRLAAVNTDEAEFEGVEQQNESKTGWASAAGDPYGAPQFILDI